jgi:hypothetical protein
LISGSVLLASLDGDAVRATIDDNLVSIEPLQDEWFATALLDTLPEAPTAKIPHTVVTAAEQNSTRPSTEHASGEQAGFLDERMQRPRRVIHQIMSLVVTPAASDTGACRSPRSISKSPAVFSSTPTQRTTSS